MNIILEGPDNCGKTTLAKAISKSIRWPIKEKEGRPPTQLALFEKFRKYEAINGFIIDRHPIISQAVYGILRNDPEIPDEFLTPFFERSDLIIYCRALRGLEDHEPSPTDDEAHLKMIEDQYGDVLKTYDMWAATSANIIYTMYEQTDWVISMVQGVVNYERG